MQQIPLTAARREDTGKGVARKLRVQGQIPAVIYGAGQIPLSLSVALTDLEKVLRQVSGSTAFLSLDISGDKKRTAVLQHLQKDYLGRRIMHVDFYEVRADQELTMEVSLHFTGDAKGVTQESGILSIDAHVIEVKGRVTDIPDSLTVDVSGLAIGDFIYARDLPLPEGVKVADKNVLVAACIPPQAEAVAAPAEAAPEGEESESSEEAETDTKE
jgi:large subunit ribosomal protein L25